MALLERKRLGLGTQGLPAGPATERPGRRSEAYDWVASMGLAGSLYLAGQQMPILPLDQPDPFMAVLGVMHYPGLDDESCAKARAFTARLLAEPVRQYLDSGQTLSNEILGQLVSDGSAPTDDWEKQQRAGIATGEILKIYYALFHTDPKLASWANAQRYAEHIGRQHEVPASHGTLYQQRSEMMTVAHLWAAYCIRDRTWLGGTAPGYDGFTDFQFFLAEAELLRRWGQSWVPSRKEAQPPLPADVWRTPNEWSPPDREPGWPRTGGIPKLLLDAEQIRSAGIRPAGRPRKS